MKFAVTEKISELSGLLRRAGYAQTAREFIGECVKVSLLAMVFAWLAWNLFFHSFLNGAVFSLLAFSAVFFLVLQKPKAKLRKKANAIEKHLPFALMQLSIDLKAGISFDSALKRLCESDYGLFSRELGKHFKGGKKAGYSTQKILLGFASENESRELRRSIAQLVSVYEHGSKQHAGEEIRRIALEILSRQKSIAKEYSGKLMVFSLAFISVSAIIPALFQAFTIVGSSFIDVSFSPLEVLLIVAVLFPLVDLALLFYIKSLTPEFLKG